MKTKSLKSLCAAALAVGLIGGPVRAELSPSFDLGYSAKHATHIVVVNGKGAILESWRGDLAAGKRVPFLAKQEAIKVDYHVDYPVEPFEDVKSVTGNRRVLFLIRSKSPETWIPANVNEPDMSLATVWIEQGQGFAIYQFRNPGPGAKMHPLYLDEAALKKQTREIAKAPRPETKPIAKPAAVLTGKWRVFLPAGYEYEITLTPGEAGQYHLAPGSLTFSGQYEIQDNHLVSVESQDRKGGQFCWKMNSPYMLTLTKQTAGVGSDYTGAVLFRQREELKREELKREELKREN
jgi:hypothetical protein